MAARAAQTLIVDRDGDIDYSKYTRRELEEAWLGINRQKYPINHARLCEALERVPEDPAPPPDEPAEEAKEAWPGPRYDADGRYIPNHVPERTRLVNALMAIALLAYGSYGVWIDDLYVPGKRGNGVHLHQVPAWLMYGAMICACIVLVSSILDHYDRRDNEHRYRRFARILSWVGWGAFGVSLAWGVFA